MQIVTDEKAAFALFDALLAHWKAEPKRSPYDKPDAVIPQNIIPAEMRENKRLLACFYFYVCIYMRGGIESLQVFRAFIRIWKEHPGLMDPYYAQWFSPAVVAKILKAYIGWDSKSASISWVENSQRLVRNWKGDPLNLIKGLDSYEEALRRIRNKLTKRDRKEAGPDGEGFRGFQPKMVSMLLYFFDWEKWLKKRFLYPTPADFHNFRLGFNQGILIAPENPSFVRTSEEISRPWRELTMKYLRARGADPVELADAIWLFSLVMCGNSPLNTTIDLKAKKNGFGMFVAEELPHEITLGTYLAPRFRNSLKRTCLQCAFVQSCRFSIPSAPYYRKGKLVLQQRPRIEEHLGIASFETRPQNAEHHKQRDLFRPDE